MNADQAARLAISYSNILLSFTNLRSIQDEYSVIYDRINTIYNEMFQNFYSLDPNQVLNKEK